MLLLKFEPLLQIMEPKRIITIYAESTPNPSSMKFVANTMLIEGAPIEFTNASQTASSPLAKKLFQFPFVKGIFISSNFITLTKQDFVEWNDIILELREFLKTYLTEGNPVLAEKVFTEKAAVVSSEKVEEKITSEIDIKIAEILDEYIKPAVESDGGAITFKSFKDGVVTVILQGSCSGCPSSTMTLKAGIEGLLKRLVPEVKEVVSEAL